MQNQIFKSFHNLTYLYIPCESSNELVVGFSAISKPNTYYFNYVNTLDGIPVNRLYILDNFGEQGSYYLGQNKDFSIETSVVSLIMKVANDLDIPLKNITTMGSSKGGYSALYFGIKYSFGKVIALAPQTLLGNFVKEHYLNVMEYITGSTNEENQEFLNTLLFDLITERDISTEIHLMVGSADSHKRLHVEPFVEHLTKNNIDFVYDVIPGVNHSQLKDYAPGYMRNYFQTKDKIVTFENAH